MPASPRPNGRHHGIPGVSPPIHHHVHSPLPQDEENEGDRERLGSRALHDQHLHPQPAHQETHVERMKTSRKQM